MYAHVASLGLANGSEWAGDAPFYHIVYFFWYPWNGCSNQKVVAQNKLGQEQLLEFYACGLGSHEGDWEVVKVSVCADGETVLRVQYSAHCEYCYSYVRDPRHTDTVLTSTDRRAWYVWCAAWDWETDCFANGGNGTWLNPGECQFYPATLHPVAFSSLNSHAAYPFTSRDVPYVQMRSPQFARCRSLGNSLLICVCVCVCVCVCACVCACRVLIASSLSLSPSSLSLARACVQSQGDATG